MVQSYRSSYEMSFRTLPDELEWTDYNGPQVKADLSRWKLGRDRRMSTRLQNKMSAREGYAHYRYVISNDTWHNRKICRNRQCMYNNIII
jgi:hypothetical protein